MKRTRIEKQEKRALRMRITWRQGKIPKNSLLFQMLDQRGIQKIQLWICCQKRQFVDVCGAVVNPGVYELDEGARIFQAVDAAGGYLPEAAINYLNRARSIGDGQQIYVPTEKEVAENLELAMAKVPEALNDGDNSGNSGLEEIQGSSVENPSGTVGRDTGSFGDGVGDDTRINLNTADAGQLSTLSGIGQSKAEAIVAYREEHGDFASIEEIMNVEGIKEGTFSKIKDKISTG